MGTDAKVTLGVAGADEVARAADRAMRPWTTAMGTAKDAARGLGESVTNAATQIVSDLSHVVTVTGAINFAQAVHEVQSFEASTAQLAIAAKRDLGAYQKEINDLGAKINQQPKAIAEWVNSVGQVTHNFAEATGNAEAFAKAAAESGRPLQAMAPLAKTFHDIGFTDAAKGLDQLRATAEKLGTVGGPQALRDQFTALDGILLRVNAKTDKQRESLVAMTGALGKGLSPELAQQSQQAILGKILGDTMATDRFLRSAGELKRGESIVGPDGKITDLPKVLSQYQSAWRKQSGSPAEAARLARLYFGDVAGAQFMNAQVGAGLAGEKGTSALEDLTASPAGQRTKNEIKKNQSMWNMFGPGSTMGGLIDSFQGFTAENPLAGKGVEMGGVAAAGALALKAKQWLTGRFAGAAGQSAGAAAEELVAKRAAVAAAEQAAMRTAAMEAAANGGWLTMERGALGKAAQLGLRGLGVLGGALEVANPAITTYAIGSYLESKAQGGRQFKEYGQDWRSRHGGVQTLEAYTKAQRAAAGVDSADAPLVAYKAARAAGASGEDAEAIAKAIAERVQVNVVIQNNSSIPSDQLQVQSASSAAGHQ